MARRKRAIVVRDGQHVVIGLVEWYEPTIGPYPYHVTIKTFAGAQYLGVCATRQDAIDAVRSNT